MDQRDGLADLAVPERAKPATLGGWIVSIHQRTPWITRMSPRRVITASPPGRSSLASEAITLSMLCIQSRLGELDDST